MRTTVNLDDHLLAEAKRLAAAQGITLGQFMDDAVRGRLAAAGDVSDPVALEFHTVPGAPNPGIDLFSNRAMFDLLDEAEREDPA
ncbi:MAG: type II toxin-antitoxin system VapB family antitoxin [Bifidobacteriaceae bacterium]|nr:type II toxin-antitoxin system VapB family antitoxin [Bifidobacteriaceae bacterium]